MKLSTLGLIVAVTVIGIVYYFRVHKPKKDMENYNPIAPDAASQIATTTAYTPPATSTTSDKVNYLQTMRRGDKGKTVEYIQMAINRVLRLEDKTTLVVDGIFGGKTETEMNNLLGKKTGSYNEVKAAVIKKFAAAGKPNPYGTSGNESSSTGSSSLSYDTIMSYLAFGGLDGNPLTFY